MSRTYPMADTIEKHTRYSTVVDDLPSAWEFVMGKIDQLGPDPAIEIAPTWSFGTDDDGDPPTRRFAVTVSGAEEEN